LNSTSEKSIYEHSDDESSEQFNLEIEETKILIEKVQQDTICAPAVGEEKLVEAVEESEAAENECRIEILADPDVDSEKAENEVGESEAEDPEKETSKMNDENQENVSFLPINNPNKIGEKTNKFGERKPFQMLGKRSTQAANEGLHEGTVRFYNKRKKYGFIDCGSFQEGVFFHHSQLQSMKNPQGGDKLQFSVQKNAKGWRAINVSNL